MLTSFYQSQISLYEAATGSTKFDEPGSLKFVWRDGRAFAYDHKSISEAIVDNLERSNLGLYSCEPTWVFTICNTQAAQGLLGYDRIHGTSYWPKVSERFRKSLVQEMMTADGGFRHIRTNAFGFSFNDGDGTGEYFTSGSHNFEDIAPDLARRGSVFSLRGVKEKMAALQQNDRRRLPRRDVCAEARARHLHHVDARRLAGVIGGARAVGNEAAVTRDCRTPSAPGESSAARSIRRYVNTQTGAISAANESQQLPYGCLLNSLE